MEQEVFTRTSVYLQAHVANGKNCIINSWDQCNTENGIADQTVLQRCLDDFPAFENFCGSQTNKTNL